MTSHTAALSGLSRRVHLVVSYGVTACVLPGVLLWWSGAVASDAGFGVLSWLQVLACALWMVHFLRRTAESAWLHRFGASRLPWGQVPFPWLYYWGFAGWIGWALAAADSAPGVPAVTAGLVLFLIGETGNFRAHLLLRRLRGSDGAARVIPRGFLFEYVSCPHYFFEIVSWVGFTMVAGSVAAAVFMLASAAILTTWATQRHRGYLREFDGREGREAYPRDRRIIVPFVY